MSPELASSYRWCWHVVRNSGSSFYRSFFLLKQPARDSIAALYAYARITDDLGDITGGDQAPVHALCKPDLLDAWLAELQSVMASSHSSHVDITVQVGGNKVGGNGTDAKAVLRQHSQLWPALFDTVKKYSIPSVLLEDVIRGVKMDARAVRIADWVELKEYCYHVASAVGLACTYIWNAQPELARSAAIDCGIAFQLTNILRDIREDAARGRIYVPQTLLNQFKCSELSWLDSQPDGDWQGCITSVYRTAAEYYARGWSTEQFLDPDGRKMFSLMWRTYRELLDEVHRHKSTLWSARKVHLPRTVRWRLAAAHFVPSLYRRLPTPSLASRCER